MPGEVCTTPPPRRGQAPLPPTPVPARRIQDEFYFLDEPPTDEDNRGTGSSPSPRPPSPPETTSIQRTPSAMYEANWSPDVTQGIDIGNWSYTSPRRYRLISFDRRSAPTMQSPPEATLPAFMSGRTIHELQFEYVGR